jgi:putative copper resistance protein D
MPALLEQLRQTGAAPQGAAGRFALVLRIEAVFLVAALVAAAFLSATPPPAAS